MNYQTNAIILDGFGAEETKGSHKRDIQEELAHWEKLGQRLKQLDACPPSSVEFTAREGSLQPPEDSANVLAVINGVLDAEEDTISTYQDLVDAAEESDDPVIEDFTISILAEKEAHRSEFRGFQKSIKND